MTTAKEAEQGDIHRHNQNNDELNRQVRGFLVHVSELPRGRMGATRGHLG